MDIQGLRPMNYEMLRRFIRKEKVYLCRFMHTV